MDFRIVDEVSAKVGGRFKFCVLVQKRVWELVKGGRPLVKVKNASPLEIAIEEVKQGKITLSEKIEEPPERREVVEAEAEREVVAAAKD